MSEPNTYKINYYLSLKLEGNHTQIYVKNEKFQQCKYLLFDVSLENAEDYDHINSIDEMEPQDRAHKYREKRRQITPKEEFWGHCSNLQAWYEHDYDTRLLHRNLAFPLLKQLSEVGDPKAKKVFKNEIALRYEEGNIVVRRFLIEAGFIEYLDLEELEVLYEIDFQLRDRVRTQIRYKQRNYANSYPRYKIVKMIQKGLFLYPEAFNYLKFIRTFQYRDLLRIKEAIDSGIFKTPYSHKIRRVLEEKEIEYQNNQGYYKILDHWLYPGRVIE